MNYLSTRGKAPALDFTQALAAGLASDGGLYVPERFPVFELGRFAHGADLISVAEKVLVEFTNGTPLKAKTAEICRRTFSFPLPLVQLEPSTVSLELFHGPTAAFKDVGARFLAESVADGFGAGTPGTVLVATSGDTGGAVGAAFHEKKDIRVLILFPKGMVSDFQERQLTGFGANVRAFRVRGNFDDCQRMVKEAFLSPDWKKHSLISANSINIGRILPQSTYYAWASLSYFQKTARRPGFVIPSGNLGNAVAAFWARKMGFPIGKIVLACNANRAVVDYFETGQWQPRPTQPTIANAMDVGSASNMERLRHLYPDLAELKREAEAYSVSDGEIRSAIQSMSKRLDRSICPHTAAAVSVRAKLPGSDWIVVATAHPAKFGSIVEPLVGHKVAIPDPLKHLVESPIRADEIDANLAALAGAL
jgi:threonine synthase